MADSNATIEETKVNQNAGVGFFGGMDWDMTSNRGLTPLVNYNFNLQVEGIYNLPCKSVRVFQRENEYETLQEGGLNDYVHLLRKPISKPMTFQVERYVGIDMLDPLALGTDLALPVLLLVSRYQGEGGNEVLDLSDSMQRIYTFTGCTVMAKEYGELNAERSGLLVETTTIAYREMICVDNPSTLSKREAWSMSEDAGTWKRAKEIRAEQKTRTGKEELSKEKMKKAAVRFFIKDGKKGALNDPKYKFEGKEKSSATKNTGELSKDAMKQQAVRFFIKGGKKEATLDPEYKFVGKEKSSAAKNPVEESKATWEAKAKMYVDPNLTKIPKHVKDYKGRKISKVENEETKEITIGIAAKQKEKSKAELETAATRYFLPGGKKIAAQGPKGTAYKGKTGQKATVDKAEVRKTALEKEAKMYVDPNLKKIPAHVKDYKGKKISKVKNEETQETTIGIAAKQKEKSKAELEKEAVRYFIKGGKKGATVDPKYPFVGKEGQNATVNASEVGKAAMEKAATRYFLPDGKKIAAQGPGKTAYKGQSGQKATVNKELGKAEMKKQAKRYFLPKGKKIAAQGPNQEAYAGKEGKKAAVNASELNKSQMKARAHKGGAKIKQMQPTRNQRRYFIAGSKSRNSYKGTVRQSATLNTNELRKPAMEANARKWPQTRSAADVAAFLKKK